MNNTKYTIAICNYNMADTLERSLESILTQIDDRFEVLVVDDGSKDSSRSILRSMEQEYDRLRTIYLEPDSNRKLGETRNISIRESNGDYILFHIDTDDVYQQGIISDFVRIYHAFEREVEGKMVKQIPGIRMAPREFLLEMGPYRNLPVGGEDMDLWRRLLASDALIYIDADRPHQSIGYEKRNRDLMKRWFRVAVSDFQTGITYGSYLRWTLSNHGFKRIGYYLVMLPVAFVTAMFREKYSITEEFHEKGELPKRLDEVKTPMVELEKKHGLQIDREELSENTRAILFESDPMERDDNQ